MINSDLISSELMALKNESRAVQLMRYFKTGPGQYGEGDVFLGISNPTIRAFVRSKRGVIEIKALKKLLHSPFHEIRLFALLYLVDAYQKSKSAREHQTIYDVYMQNLSKLNNWDLIDISASNILGNFILQYQNSTQQMEILTTLAKSTNLWEARASMIATFSFIKQKHTEPTLTLARLLLKHPHHLIQKATGWVLRELGKNCSETILLGFLRDNYAHISRTTFRYAIEKFDSNKRQKLLRGDFS